MLVIGALHLIFAISFLVDAGCWAWTALLTVSVIAIGLGDI